MILFDIIIVFRLDILNKIIYLIIYMYVWYLLYIIDCMLYMCVYYTHTDTRTLCVALTVW